MLKEMLAWYLTPWRRMGRGTFNLVLVAVTLPSLLLMLFGFVDATGGLLAPLLNMLAAGQSLQDAVGGPQGGVDLYALGDSMRQMQGAGEGFQTFGEGITQESLPWGEWLDLAMWLLVLPMVQMRLRDVGIRRPRKVWVYTGLVYAGVAMDIAHRITGVEFGGWQILASIVAFVLVGWLAMAKSQPVEHQRVTTPAASGSIAGDDDPFPPFRP